MTANQFFDRPCQSQRFTKRRTPAQLHDKAGDPAGGWFLAELTKQASQFLFLVLVYNFGRSEPGPRDHAHVQWPTSPEAEAALCVFQLSSRPPQLKTRATNRGNAKLVKNTAG